MYENEIGRIPETVLHARFVRALPDEYSTVKRTLQSMKNRDRDEIIRMISTRSSNVPQKKAAQRSSRQPEHAFVSSESGGRSSARPGRGSRSGGGQGRGRDESSNGAGGNINSSGNSRNSTGGAQGSSGRGGGRLYMPPNRCFHCKHRSHRGEDCTTKECEFVPRCIRCTGFGHDESSCSSNAAVLVVELPISKKTSPWKLRRSR